MGWDMNKKKKERKKMGVVFRTLLNPVVSNWSVFPSQIEVAALIPVWASASWAKAPVLGSMVRTFLSLQVAVKKLPSLFQEMENTASGKEIDDLAAPVFKSQIFKSPAVLAEARTCDAAVWKARDSTFFSWPFKTSKGSVRVDLRPSSGMLHKRI